MSAKPRNHQPAIEFLPDADELERSPLPMGARITVHVLFGALLVFLLWASIARVDLVVVARGRLSTLKPNLVVQPLEMAIIQSLDVRVGDVVKRGQRLATLDSTFAEADQEQLQDRVRSLDTQSRQLQAEVSGEIASSAAANDADAQLQADLAAQRRANYQAQLDRLEQSIAGLKASLASNHQDQGLLAERVKTLREIESMQESIVAQHLSAKLNLLEARNDRLAIERELSLARNREQELGRELRERQAERDAFDRSWRQKTMEDLLATTRDRDALLEQLQKAQKRNQLVNLEAPADAVVLSIAKLSAGSVVREAETLFTLVPLDDELRAEVEIAAADVGYVQVGAPARIKLDAFPFQRHGSLDAKLSSISSDAFHRDPTATLPARDAYYLGQIELGPVQLRNLAPNTRLLPGMTLSAEIVVGDRTVMSYLLWPLTKALDESIREP